MTGSAKGRAWRGGRRGERTESVIPLPLFAVATLVELGVPDVSYHSFRKTVGTLIDGRVKVIGRLPGEATCLSLVWAVLDRASRGWRGVTQTSATIRQLQDLREQLLEPPRQLRPRTTKTGKTKTVTGRVT